MVTYQCHKNDCLTNFTNWHDGWRHQKNAGHGHVVREGVSEIKDWPRPFKGMVIWKSPKYPDGKCPWCKHTLFIAQGKNLPSDFQSWWPTQKTKDGKADQYVVHKSRELTEKCQVESIVSAMADGDF